MFTGAIIRPFQCRRRSLISVLLLCFTGVLTGQSDHRGYDAPFNRTTPLANGDHLMVGIWEDPPYYLARLDAAGQVIWARLMGVGAGRMDGPVEAVDGTLVGVIVMPDGPVLYCLDAAGDVLWAKTITIGTAVLNFPALTATTDSAFALVVRATFPDTTNVVIKVDATGDIIWARQPVFPGTMTLCTEAMSVTGGLVLMEAGTCEPRLARVANDGSSQWAWSTDPGSGCWSVSEVAELTNGDLFVAYLRGSAAGDPEDLIVARLAGDGDMSWYRAYDAVPGLGGTLPGTDGMIATNNGVVLAPGDPLLMRFMHIDTLGTVLWTAALPTNNVFASIAPAGGDSIWAVTYQFGGLPCQVHRIAIDQPLTACMTADTVAEVPSFVTHDPVAFTTIPVPVTTAPFLLSTVAVPVGPMTVCGSVGQAEIPTGSPEFLIAPNPSRDAVTFTYATGRPLTVILRNAQGTLMRSADLQVQGHEAYRMQVDDLLPGIYLLELSDDSGRLAHGRLVVE